MELEQQDGSKTLCGKPGFFVTSIIKHLSDKRDNAILTSICFSLDFTVCNYDWYQKKPKAKTLNLKNLIDHFAST